MIKLLLRHISLSQLFGFFISNLVGMLIILSALQIYADISPMLNNGNSFMKPENMVLSKKVTTYNTISGSAPSFAEYELDDIRKQPFVKEISPFVPALFDVKLSLGSEHLGMNMTTDMFLEALPSKYIDVDLSKWEYIEGAPLPMIIPRNYLNLYNFGFAASRQLPALSESILSDVPFKLRIRGNNKQLELETHVVGYSNEINTILVPLEFMEYANSRFAAGEEAKVSRIVMEVENPTDEAIIDFINESGYVLEGDTSDTSKVKYFLRVLVSIAIFIGGLISALSLYVLLLSIFLLLQKLTAQIDTLLLLGYKLHSIAIPYCLLGVFLNLLSLVLAIFSVSYIQGIYTPLLTKVYPQFEAISMSTTVTIGVVLVVVISIINSVAITQKVKAIWNIHKKR